MDISYQDPSSGKYVFINVDERDQENISKNSELFLTEEKLKQCIANLNVPADLKLFLEKLTTFTVAFGKQIVSVGKKILELIIMFSEKFKHATCGVVIALVLSILIGAVPFLGPFLVSLLTPILVIMGLTGGLLEDLKDSHPELVNTINRSIAIFAVFKPA